MYFPTKVRSNSTLKYRILRFLRPVKSGHLIRFQFQQPTTTYRKTLMPIKVSVERQTFSFDADAIGIGGSSENQIAFPNDPRVKPLHAVLRCVNGRWIVEAKDGGPIRIGSGRPTQFAWVNSGDVIRLTETGPDLVFEMTKVSESPIVKSVVSPESGPVESNIESVRASIPRGNVAKQISSVTNLKRELKESISTRSTFSPAKRNGVRQVSLILAVAIVLVAVAGAVKYWLDDPSNKGHRGGGGEAYIPPPPPPPPPPAVPPPPTLDPDAFLVLIGVGKLNSDDRPHVLSVGWLFDKQTVVVSRYVAKAIEEFESDAKRKSNPARGCVIQGLPLEIDSISHPTNCSGISILRLKSAAELASSAHDQWERVNYQDIEKRRIRTTLTYYSFQLLPRPESVNGSHGFPLCEYDPDVCRPGHTTAKLVFEQRQHVLNLTDPPVSLERGGLLCDDKGQIVGTVLHDLTIVWTDDLQKALDSK